MTLRKMYPLVAMMALVTACGQEFRTLSNLGSHNDYSDLEIEDNFSAPEDEDSSLVLAPPADSLPGEIATPPTVPEAQMGTNPELSPIESLLDTFFFEDRTFQLAHNSALKWGGCNSTFRSNGGYNSDSKCGTAFIQELFADNLNDVFFQCIDYAARDAGYPKPQKVFINHLGSYNNRNARNSANLSNHAYARALDIKNFNLIDAKGQVQRVSTLLRDYVGQQAIFYDSFRACWKDSLPSSCRPGNSEYQGSIGHKSSKLGGNTLHNDHIHLSLPRCAGPV